MANKNVLSRRAALWGLGAAAVGAVAGGAGEVEIESKNRQRIPDINDEIARHEQANQAFDKALDNLPKGKQATIRAEIDKQRKELDSERGHDVPMTWNSATPTV